MSYYGQIYNKGTENMDEEHYSASMPIWNLVLAMAAPFFVWPVEVVMPWPFLVEELVKWGLVYKPAQERNGWWYGLGVGLLFGLSEAMLYVVNAALLGRIGVLGMRLVVTVPMHAVTTLFYYWGGRWGVWGAVLSLLVGMLLHWGFNIVVGGWGI